MFNESPFPARVAIRGAGTVARKESEMTTYREFNHAGIMHATEYAGYLIAPRMGRFDVVYDGKVAGNGMAWGFDSEHDAKAWIDANPIATEPAKPAKPVARAIVREAAQTRTAFIEAGDSDNAERVAMGLPVKDSLAGLDVTVIGTETGTESPVTLAVTSAPLVADEPALDPAETIRAAIGSLAYACGALDAPSFSTMRANLADLERLLATMESEHGVA